MNLKITALFIFLVSYTFITAQQLETNFNIYSSKFPSEKLHFHTDKETYLPGETIWFKAYLLSDGLPSTQSTNLYADLLDENGKIMQHKTMPILSSTADSYFTIPDSLQNNQYVIRAYTTWMLNFDNAFIFHKKIKIASENELKSTTSPLLDVSLQFFAEGGNMIAGLYNYLAFKATQSNGMPYNIKAAIKNNKGELVDSIESLHNGMGLLKFTPETGETYTAEWKDNKGVYRRTTLPTAQATGIILHTEQVQNDLYYLINTPFITNNLQQLTVMATINQKIVYTAIIKPKETTINQKINTSTFESGILQLTVFDSNNQPLAERIVFINNNNYSFTTQLNIKESSLAKRGKNSFEIEVPDTLSSNLSIAVYDANLEEQNAQTNIYSNLLLQSDIKGYVHNAAWYFEKNNSETKQGLDLVMQTNGWRRYNWDNITTQKMPLLPYPPDNYLSIYGKATDAKQLPKANEMISLILQAADSSKQWYMPLTDKDGLFTQSGLIFYDTATLFYKASNAKDKSIGVGLAKNNSGLNNTQLTTSLPQWIQPQNAALATEIISVPNTYTKTFLTERKNKNPGFEQTAKVLNEVVVKSSGRNNWKNDPLIKMDEKYAVQFRGVGSNNYVFDVAHDSAAWGKLDIYNYLSGKAPFLIQKYNGTSKTLSYYDVEPIYFMNENEVERDVIETINLEDIAYIKAYPRMGWRQGFPPGILIYLKKGDDLKGNLKNLPSNLSKTIMVGYSPTKEFYSPDYSVLNKNASADLRSTLYWQPYILTNKANNKALIDFYNNDISTKLKVVIEGMNEDGKLIHIEKIID